MWKTLCVCSPRRNRRRWRTQSRGRQPGCHTPAPGSLKEGHTLSLPGKLAWSRATPPLLHSYQSTDKEVDFHSWNKMHRAQHWIKTDRDKHLKSSITACTNVLKLLCWLMALSPSSSMAMFPKSCQTQVWTEHNHPGLIYNNCTRLPNSRHNNNLSSPIMHQVFMITIIILLLLIIVML